MPTPAEDRTLGRSAAGAGQRLPDIRGVGRVDDHHDPEPQRDKPGETGAFIDRNPGSGQVDERQVENPRALYTIGAEHEFWWLFQGDPPTDVGFRIPGAFVRLEPPEHFSTALLPTCEALLHAAGAAKVVVVHAKKPRAVLESTAPQIAHRSHREVVVAMVAEAVVDDRPALATLCEGIMAQVKL